MSPFMLQRWVNLAVLRWRHREGLLTGILWKFHPEAALLRAARRTRGPTREQGDKQVDGA